MRHRPELLACAGIAILTLAAYGRAVGFGFVGFDDQVYVTENPHVLSGLSPSSIAWAFTTMSGSNWHPLTWLSLMLDVQIAGPAPAVYHVTNVLLHIVNALLLFYVLRRMTGAVGRSALVAALFALHPLHVESVAWVAERKDVLSTMFWHLTMLGYVRYVERKSAGRYAALIGVYACGLLSKPMLVTLPLVLLLLDYWPLGRLGVPELAGDRSMIRGAGRVALRKASLFTLVREKGPLFALAAASCAVTLVAQASGNAIATLERFPLGARLGNAGVSYIAYLWSTLWPFGLTVQYPHPGAGLAAWKPLVSWAILLVLTALALTLRRRRPYLAVGWIWYLLTLVPVIGFVQVGMQARADRYTYVPLTGIFIVIAWGGLELVTAWSPHGDRSQLRTLPSRAWRAVPGVAAGLVVVVLAMVTYVQAGHWRNRVLLFKHSIEVLPDDPISHSALGSALLAQGDVDRAIAQFRECIRLDPSRAASRGNLGVALARRGHTEEAIHELSEAVRLAPPSAEDQNNLGAVLAAAGRIDEALVHHREAVRLAPNLMKARIDLGEVLLRIGAVGDAVVQYEAALSIEPASADARTGLSTARANLAGLLLKNGKVEEAIAQCTEALRLSPALPAAHANLGLALSRKGNFKEAAAYLERALAARPNDPVLHGSLGLVWMRSGRLAEAAREFGEAVRLEPGLTEAHLNLGVILANLGQGLAAAEQFDIVLRQKPGDERALKNLAILRSDAAGARSKSLRNRGML